MCPDNFDFQAITNFHAKSRTFKKKYACFKF